MRNNVELDLHANRNRGGGVSSFTISYQGKNPQAVMLTANRVATLFIEENLKSREQQARKTTIFLKNELLELKINNAKTIDKNIKTSPVTYAVLTFIIPAGSGLYGRLTLSDSKSGTSLWTIVPAERKTGTNKIMKI